MALRVAHVKFVRSLSWIDLFLLAGIFLSIYAVVGVATEWVGPFRSRIEIDLTLSALPRYTFFSLIRGVVAYGCSLLFAITYGYMAAQSRTYERILIPLLDILQSIPILGILPGAVLALVSIFPRSNVGLELASVFMIFNGQVWNMTFSFYSSVKSVPQELREVSSMFRLRKLDVLTNVEIPFSMNGLLWNSMLSMAGGWFFLMVAESFSLGEKDFRLPGIGSYMAVAIEKGDRGAMVAGIVAMVSLIVVVDRFFWAPLVHWSERFKGDRDGNPQPPPLMTRWLSSSALVRRYQKWAKQLRKQWKARRKDLTKLVEQTVPWTQRSLKWAKIGRWCLIIIGGMGFLYGLKSLHGLLIATPGSAWWVHFRNTFVTFLRVMVAVTLGSLWTIPAGVFIGTHPSWSRRLQPVVQVVAAFPAPMVFPIVTLLFLKLHISFEIASVFLMMLGSQWYILFNVISGASLIPQNLKDVSDVFHVKGKYYWKAIILPAIFPSLVDAWITAAGGAWNACIVSEFLQYAGKTYTATGIGASISEAAADADFPRLAAGIVTMVVMIVIFNRFFWRFLYRLAETRFRLE